MSRPVVQVQVLALGVAGGGFALILGNEQKAFVMCVDASVGTAIALFLQATPKARPLTHDLIADVLGALGAGICKKPQAQPRIVGDLGRRGHADADGGRRGLLSARRGPAKQPSGYARTCPGESRQTQPTQARQPQRGRVQEPPVTIFPPGGSASRALCFAGVFFPLPCRPGEANASCAFENGTLPWQANGLRLPACATYLFPSI
jgi:hypothetical protein